VRHAFTGTLLNVFQDIRLPLFRYGRLPIKQPLEQEWLKVSDPVAWVLTRRWGA
jgi:hypothetical protein